MIKKYLKETGWAGEVRGGVCVIPASPVSVEGMEKRESVVLGD